VALAAWFAGARAAGAAEFLSEPVRHALQEAGARTYSHKPKYSKTSPDMYLGYDGTGAVVVGVVVSSFYAYEDLTAVLIVRREGDSYIAERTEVPDLGVLKDRDKIRQVLDTLTAAAGITLRDAAGRRRRIDAVTRATRYQWQVYTTLDGMARRVVAEMEASPAWPRAPVP
jgi:hypothetical protein